MTEKDRMASATEVLAQAEALDGYRAACAASELNAAARANDRYVPTTTGVMFTKKLVTELNKIKLLNGIDVVVLDSSADNGYPHTRAGGVVCIPSRLIEVSTQESLAETLRHEAIHIHQRQHPELWAAACVREGWWPLPQGQIPQRFRERCRINPDTFYSQPFWSWEERYVPLPLFSSPNPKTIAEVEVQWYDLRSGELYRTPPASFVKRYGAAVSQPEHPFELLAVEAAAAGITTHEGVVQKLMTRSK